MIRGKWLIEFFKLLDSETLEYNGQALVSNSKDSLQSTNFYQIFNSDTYIQLRTDIRKELKHIKEDYIYILNENNIDIHTLMPDSKWMDILYKILINIDLY